MATCLFFFSFRKAFFVLFFCVFLLPFLFFPHHDSFREGFPVFVGFPIFSYWFSRVFLWFSKVFILFLALTGGLPQAYNKLLGHSRREVEAFVKKREETWWQQWLCI